MFIQILKYIYLIKATYFYNVKNEGFIGKKTNEIFPYIVTNPIYAIEFEINLVDESKHEFIIKKKDDSSGFDIYNGLKNNSLNDQKLNLYNIHKGTNQRFKIVDPKTKESLLINKIYTNTEYNIVIGDKCLYVKYEDKKIYLGNCNDNKLESLFLLINENTYPVINYDSGSNNINSKTFAIRNDDDSNIINSKQSLNNINDVDNNKNLRIIKNNEYSQQNLENNNNKLSYKPISLKNENNLSNMENNYKQKNFKTIPDIEIADKHPDKIVVPTTEVHNITYTEVKDITTIDKIVEPTQTRLTVIEEPIKNKTLIKTIKDSNDIIIPESNYNLRSKKPVRMLNDNNDILNDEEVDYKKLMTRNVKNKKYNKKYDNNDDFENDEMKYKFDYQKFEKIKKNNNIKQEDIDYFKKNYKNISDEHVDKYVDKKLSHLSSEKQLSHKNKIKNKINKYKMHKAKLVTEEPVKVKTTKKILKDYDDEDNDKNKNKKNKRTKKKKLVYKNELKDVNNNKLKENSKNLFD